MDEDHRELVRRLFAAATALIETAHDAAVAGQSGEIAAGDYTEAARRLQAVARGLATLAEAARRLQATARDVAALAEAAMIVAHSGINQHRK